MVYSFYACHDNSIPKRLIHSGPVDRSRYKPPLASSTTRRQRTGLPAPRPLRAAFDPRFKARMMPPSSQASIAGMLRRELPTPHPGVQLQIRIIRWSSNTAEPRTAGSSQSAASRETARSYAYSVRAIVPAALKYRSAGLGEQDRAAFVQALRQGIQLLVGPGAGGERQRGPKELWAGEHHLLTLVADNPTAALLWEIRGFKIKLSHDQAEQLVATLETVPVLVQQMVRKNEDPPT